MIFRIVYKFGLIFSVLSQFTRLADRRIDADRQTDGQNSHRYTASALHAARQERIKTNRLSPRKNTQFGGFTYIYFALYKFTFTLMLTLTYVNLA